MVGLYDCFCSANAPYNIPQNVSILLRKNNGAWNHQNRHAPLLTQVSISSSIFGVPCFGVPISAPLQYEERGHMRPKGPEPLWYAHRPQGIDMGTPLRPRCVLHNSIPFFTYHILYYTIFHTPFTIYHTCTIYYPLYSIKRTYRDPLGGERPNLQGHTSRRSQHRCTKASICRKMLPSSALVEPKGSTYMYICICIYMVYSRWHTTCGI